MIAVLLLAAMVALAAWAEPPPFADKAIPTENPSSFPEQFCVSDDALYFVADDGIHGRELWMWQPENKPGGLGNCSIVADIAPVQNNSNPERLSSEEGWLYFVADAPEAARNCVWAWHQDADNPFRVIHTSGNTDLYDAHFLGMAFDRLCLSAWERGAFFGLYATEPGSPSAAHIDVLPTPPAPGGESLCSVRAQNGALFYYGTDSLMSTDGTKGGTRRVHAFHEGTDLFLTGAMCALGDCVLFVGLDEEHRRELWATDGSTEGTRLVKDIAPERASSEIRELFAHRPSGMIYFGAEDGQHGRELWKTDGTPEGTALVKDVHRGRSSSDPYGAVSVGDWLYFLANDGTHGKEVWRTDGSEEGTEMVADLFPGLQGSDPWRLTCFDDKLFFCANSPMYGEEIFVTDGTSQGTRVLRDIVPGPGSSGPHNLTVFGENLFFTCDDGIHGEELWMTDGTAESTHLAVDIYPLRFNPPSAPRELTALNDVLVFAARDAEHGEELWVSDGTPAGTRLLRDVRPGPSGSSPRQLVGSNGRAFFTADGPDSVREIWCTEGTPERTRPVLDDSPVEGEWALELFCSVGGVLYFTAEDSVDGRGLWVSDGSPEGTRVLRNSTPGSEDAPVVHAFEFRGKAFFYTQEAHGEVSTWVTDGTDKGTVLLAQGALPSPLTVAEAADAPGPPASLSTEGDTDDLFLVRLLHPPGKRPIESLPATIQGTTYFVRRTPRYGAELWRTDGTPANTHLVQDAFPGPSSGSPTYLTRVGDGLYFVAEHPVEGRVLWHSDGSAAGTSPVTQLSENGQPFRVLASELVALKDTLVLCSLPSLDRKSQPNNAELRLVKHGRENERAVDVLEEIRAGPEGSWPRQLARAGDRVFFTADDGIHGEELWVTDGTRQGTRLIKDILVPGNLLPLAK